MKMEDLQHGLKIYSEEYDESLEIILLNLGIVSQFFIKNERGQLLPIHRSNLKHLVIKEETSHEKEKDQLQPI